ncbi:MAG: ABC transporter ATP-binding protein [Thaumarchaeota archaeon]|nr:ABC transporter ATP-binding protein [Nitrososphaerota archaeon]
MISIRGLNAGYGRLQVIFDLTTQFEAGKINVVVGPNGSGKSTLLRSVFGLTRIYGGEIVFGNSNLVGLSPHEIARMGVAYLPQVDSVFASLKVSENLRMAAYTVHKDDVGERTKELVEIFPILKKKWEDKAQFLSGGERQMVAMAMALIRKPRAMLFDEPTGNLAPLVANKVLKQIVDLSREMGLTVVLVEQNARKALEIGDKACLLVSGRIAFEGRCQDLLEEKELTKLYLGAAPSGEQR